MTMHARARAIKNGLRVIQRKVRRYWVESFRSFGAPELQHALSRVGLRPGDSVMIHSAFEAHHGFRGSSKDAVDAILEYLGPSGNLLMVSMPYHTSSLDYLQSSRRFDVRKTPSAMGMMSEIFRRRRGVLRSVHPTHPILAYGAKADWFVADHERCEYPCGPGTPFDKLLRSGGKVLFYNIPFAYFTFFHYLEHLVQTALPFPLYTQQPFAVPVVDHAGDELVVRTYVFSKEAIASRRFDLFERYVRQAGLVSAARVGASTLELVALAEIVSAVEEMMARRMYFHDFPDGARSRGPK